MSNDQCVKKMVRPFSTVLWIEIMKSESRTKTASLCLLQNSQLKNMQFI